MKFAIVLPLVLVFLGISAFGFLEMSHENGFLYCLASAVHGGVACPENNLLENLEFHFSAIEFFSLATINFTLVAGAVLILIPQYVLLRYLADKPFFVFAERLQFERQSYKSQLLTWLALHENSPTLA